jgi:hypothetical protein
MRDALLVDLLAVNAVREPVHHRRTLAAADQRSVGDRDVVVDEVTLRPAERREVDLVRVRDSEGASGALDLAERRGHAFHSASH